MIFTVMNEIQANNVTAIERALKTVDADAVVRVDIRARTVSVDSWLMPEEFIVAFTDEDYDVSITEA
jgi:copper chaperone CopZ